jgi:hypothetical protein
MLEMLKGKATYLDMNEVLDNGVYLFDSLDLEAQ